MEGLVTYEGTKNGLFFIKNRDTEVLKDLYRLRFMTISQINIEYFGTAKYVYNRLGRMKEAGLIDAIPLLRNQDRDRDLDIRIGKVYYITPEGVKHIEDELEEDVDISKLETRTAIKSSTLARYLIANEVQIALREHGFILYSSPIVKDRYNLNRGDQIAGVLERGSERIGLYIPNSDEMVYKRISTEIDRVSMHGIGDIAILCWTDGILERYRGLQSTARSIMVLPFLEGIGILKQVIGTNFIERLIKRELNLSLVSDVDCLFARYIATDGRREYYVSELLTGDLITFRGLLSYTPRQAAKDRPVYLLLWTYQRWEREMFEEMPHIKIIEIEPDFGKLRLSDTVLPRLKPCCPSYISI